MAMTWSDLERSALFGWFHIAEVSREERAGITVVTCKPGAFTEAITIVFDLDKTATVQQAKLMLGRDWMEGERNAPFGVDIAKSFLLTLASPKSTGAMFAVELERELAVLPGVISRASTVKESPTVSNIFAQGIATYRGMVTSVVLPGSEDEVRLENGAGSSGARVLSITWLAKSPPSFFDRIRRIWK